MLEKDDSYIAEACSFALNTDPANAELGCVSSHMLKLAQFLRAGVLKTLLVTGAIDMYRRRHLVLKRLPNPVSVWSSLFF